MRNLRALFPRLLLSLGSIPAALACGGALATEDSFEDSDASANDAGRKKDALNPRRDACFNAQWGCSDGTYPVDGTAELASKQSSCADPNTAIAGSCSSCGKTFNFCRPINAWDPNKCGEGTSIASNNCLGYDRQVPCALPLEPTDWLPTETCKQYCPLPQNFGFSVSCQVIAEKNGFALHCQPQCGVGRRPGGLVEQTARGASATGRFLAKLVELEAASVDAFEILGNELARHGAPTRILRRIEVARRDEIRHARSMTRLTNKFAGVPIVPIVQRKEEARSLEEIALENAVEGCVRETFGALVAHYQAEHADDEEVRIAMKHIARDETKHAELSWSIFDWALARMSEETRVRVENAMREAVLGLSRHEGEEEPETARALGLPSLAVRAELLEALTRELWAHDARIAA